MCLQTTPVYYFRECIQSVVESAKRDRDDSSFISPQLEDIMLTDVSEKDVRESIAQGLETTYLGVSTGEPSWPARGIVYGKNKRLFINLFVKLRASDPEKNVIFLVDTSSPNTFLCATAMSSLLPPDNPLPDQLRGFIHGKLHGSINLSPPSSHFSEINVLGTDFMYDHNLVLNVPWRSLDFTLSV